MNAACPDEQVCRVDLFSGGVHQPRTSQHRQGNREFQRIFVIFVCSTQLDNDAKKDGARKAYLAHDGEADP